MSSVPQALTLDQITGSPNAPTPGNVAAWRQRQARGAANQQAAEAQTNEDLGRVEQTRQQNLELYTRQHPILGRILNAGLAGTGAQTNALANLANAVGIQQPSNLSSVISAQNPSYGAPGAVGETLGTVAPIVATGPLAPLTTALSAGGGIQRDIAARQAAGEHVSPQDVLKQAIKAYGQTVAGTVAPLVGKEAGAEVGGTAGGRLGAVAAPVGTELATGNAVSPMDVAGGLPGGKEISKEAVHPFSKETKGYEPTNDLAEGKLPPVLTLKDVMHSSPEKQNKTVEEWQQQHKGAPPAQLQPPGPRNLKTILAEALKQKPAEEKTEPPVAAPQTSNPAGLSNKMLRQHGFAQTPNLPKIGEEGTIARLTGTGQVGKTLRTMTAGNERDTHNILTNLKPHFKTAENIFGRAAAINPAFGPRAIGNFIDTVEKTGKSPYPELQPAVDKYMKLHANLIARDKASGGNTEGHTPNHIQFIARPTKNTLPVNKGSGLTGPEGNTYERTSKNFPDFLNKANEAGMEIPYHNPLEMMSAGLSQYARAINAREMVNQNWKPSGIAEDMPSKGKIPDGWMKAPGIENTIVPDEVGKSLKYYYDSKAPSKDISAAMRFGNSIAQKFRFIGDTVTMARQIGAGLGNTIAMGARTGNVLKYNPINALKEGRKFMTQSSEDLKASGDPADRMLAHNIDDTVKAGLRANGMKKLPRPDSERTTFNTARDMTRKVTHALNNFGGQMKAGWAILASDYAHDQQIAGKWSSQDAVNFTRRYIKFQDDAMGGSGSVNTAHPGIKIAADITSPLWKYQTAGLRSSARSLGEAVASKSISKSTIPEALSHLTAHIALGVGAGLAISKATTGSAIPPTSPLDLFFPKIGKNADGTDKRLGVAGIFLPLAEQIVRLSKGELGKAGGPILNPAITAAAQAITNHDWKGDTIGDGSLKDRAWYFLKQSMSPITWSEMSEGNLAGALAFRTAPKDISRSKAENLAVDLEQGKHTPREANGDYEQESQWESRLRQGYVRKTNSWSPDARKAEQEMLKAGYPTSSIKLMARHAQIPPGIAGVPYSNLDPRDIMQVWQTASPEERKTMMPGFRERFAIVAKNAEKEKPAVRQAWKDLYNAVNAAGTNK